MLTSTRRGISYPNTDFSDRPNIPAHMLNLVNALEQDVVYGQGTNANRLAAGHMVGVLYYETDTGQTWYDDGSVWHKVGGSGIELDYAQITSNSGTISATTEATSVAIITGNSVAYDGTRNRIRAFVPSIFPSVALNATFVLYRDSTVIGQIYNGYGASNKYYLNIESFDTPAAGSHTYKVSAFVSTGNIIAQAGAGGAGAAVPAFLQVVRA